MTKNLTTRSGIAAAALLALLTLGACDRRDDGQTTGQKVDSAIDKADAKSDAAKASAGQTMDEAKKATSDAVQSATTAVTDTAITTAIKAGLAADADLKAVDVNVETNNGRVTLRGMAPDAAARDRATQIATGTKGVSAVDNQVTTVR